MKKQALALTLALACAGLAGARAEAQVATPAATSGGFYGGIALRQLGAEETGVTFGTQSSTWGRFTSPLADDAASRKLFFGGYRFQNDVAVEASFTTSERYLLRPDNPGGSGVGLSLMPSDAASRAWNADVYTSWSVLQHLSLYGRLGYAQSDNGGGLGLAALPPGDPRRGREGVNYGVGLRYDFNPALGLRLEYARFGRFAGETVQGGVLPDTDQVQLGVQLRF